MGGGVALSDALKRQWVPVAGGSCDVRLGYGALEQASTIVRDSVGRPRKAMVVAFSSSGDEVRELLRRQLVHVGFEVSWHLLDVDSARSVEQAMLLCEGLAKEHMTGEDLCCAMGDSDLLSMVAYVCGSWCGGMPYVAVPTDEVALLEGVITPRALDVGKCRRMVSVQPSAQHALLDLELGVAKAGTQNALHANALMASTAMASSERVFSELWDHADDLAQGDEEVRLTQLLATAKQRGLTASSTAAAIRMSLDYGQSFSHALGHLTGGEVAPSVRLAEGMRFCARLAVALDKLSIDDLLAQDELLQMLGVGSAVCDVDAQELADALRHEHYSHTNRFMLLVPFGIGRVRLAAVPKDLLLEHAQAWCSVHRKTTERS